MRSVPIIETPLGRGLPREVTMKTQLKLILAGALAASFTTVSTGQITTPPPEKPAVPEEYVPSTPAPAPVSGEPIGVRPTKPGPTPAPNVPYEPLAQVDAATGKFKPLNEPAEWLAVKKNPLVTADDWAKIEPFKVARIKRYEQIVTQNLGAIDQVRGGIMNEANPGNKQAFGGIVNLVKPLTTPNAPAAFASALQTAQLLNQDQANLSRKMANEYAFHIAAGPEAVKAGKRGKPEESMVEVLKQRLEEPLYVYKQMQIEASSKLATLLPGVVKDAEAMKKAQAVAAKVTQKSSDEERASLMTELEKGLSVDERKALYEAMIAGRTN